MHIQLINLPREGETRCWETRDYLLTDFSKYPPLGLMAIATEIDRRHHDVRLCDANIKGWTIAQTVQHIAEQRPDVLGMTVVTRRLWAMCEIARQVKEALPHTRIVAGGPHVNYWPEETLAYHPAIDFCLPGFAERTFPQLIEAIDRGGAAELLARVPALYYRGRGKILRNPEEKKPRELDDIPFPDRSLIDIDDYYTAVDLSRMTTMYSSRGCPFQCIFCDVQEKRYYYRSAKSVVDEFEHILTLGIEEIHIFDDIFNVRQDRVDEICREILRRGINVRWSIRARVNPWRHSTLELLKRAGCGRIHVGVESLDPATLEYMRKAQTLEDINWFFDACHELDIETLAYFIVGFPTESEEYREMLYKRILGINPTYMFVNILYPFAKTAYYDGLIKSGVYTRDYWLDYIMHPTPEFEMPLPWTEAVHKKLIHFADRAHRKFCYRPSFLVKEFFRSVRFPKILFFKMKLFFILARETTLSRFWPERTTRRRMIGSDATHIMHEG